MLRPVDNYFLQKEEPLKSCLQFLRTHILNYDKNISEAWKYGMPFYFFNGKRFCYLWIHKKYNMPYIGITDGKKINHPGLIIENRSRMKIFLVDPAKSVPVKKIDSILKAVLELHK
jgi:uncharacterized protein DUF1801